MIPISELTNPENLPIHLLLSSDPDLQKIKSYCQKNKIFTAQKENKIIGVYVLKIKNAPSRTRFGNNAEILNIAVEKKYQNIGIGKQLIQHAIEYCKKEKIKILEVGTGNSSISQIAFYQKCGFRIKGVIKNYFIENYVEPIWENGIQCRDRILFEIKI